MQAVGIACQLSQLGEAEVENLGHGEEDDEEEEPLFICTARLSQFIDGMLQVGYRHNLTLFLPFYRIN